MQKLNNLETVENRLSKEVKGDKIPILERPESGEETFYFILGGGHE